MVLYNKYQKIKDLGAGGMASVVLAKEINSDRRVAIKILHKVQSKKEIQRFFKEARIIARLSHENIVKIFESNFHEDQHYIVMEYLAGGDFGEYLKKTDNILLNLKIIIELLSGLQYVHLKGIVHRDIKPTNILLTGDGVPKLSDFGIATSLFGEESRFTKSNEILGTIDYIAPEQRESTKLADFRADIYSIGAIIYEILTGRKATGLLIPPIEINFEIPQELNQLVLKTLQYDPNQRYKSIINLQNELKEIVMKLEPALKRVLKGQNRSLNPKTQKTGSLIRVLLNKLSDSSVSERFVLKEKLLTKIDKSDESLLIKLLNSENHLEKEIAILGLGKLKSKKACEFLVDFLNESYYNKMVAKVLGDIGCLNASHKLFELLKMKRDDNYVALIPLAKLGFKKAIPYMKKDLYNTHDFIREDALRSLSLVGCKDLNKILKDFVSREKDPRLRAKANNILWRFESK